MIIRLSKNQKSKIKFIKQDFSEQKSAFKLSPGRARKLLFARLAVTGLSKRNANKSIERIQKHLDFIEANVKKLNLNPTSRNKKKIQKEIDDYEKLEVLQENARQILKDSDNKASIFNLGTTKAKNIESDFEKIRSKHEHIENTPDTPKPKIKGRGGRPKGSKNKPKIKKINRDTASNVEVQEVNEDIVDYLKISGEKNAAESVESLIKQAYSVDAKENVEQPAFDQKLLNVNIKILEVLRKIQRDMFDEQDTSIKKKQKVKKSSVSTSTLMKSDKKGKSENDEGFMDSVFDAAKAIGAIAALKAVQSVKKLFQKEKPDTKKTSSAKKKKPTIKKTSMSLGKIGRKALRFAKAAGPIGAVITAGLAVYDGVQGWNDAAANLGLKEGEKATFGQKAASAAGAMISGISFGLLDTKETSQTINNFFSGDTTINKYEKSGLLTHNTFGDSVINNWEEFSQLDVKEMQKIINFNDWSKSDLTKMQEIKIQKINYEKHIDNAKKISNDKTIVKQKNSVDANTSKYSIRVESGKMDDVESEEVKSAKLENMFVGDTSMNIVDESSRNLIKTIGMEYFNSTGDKITIGGDNKNVSFSFDKKYTALMDSLITNHSSRITRVLGATKSQTQNYVMTKQTSEVNNFKDFFSSVNDSKNESSSVMNEIFVEPFKEKDSGKPSVNDTIQVNKFKKEEITKNINENLKNQTVNYQSSSHSTAVMKAVEPIINNINITKPEEDKKISAFDLFS